MVFLSVIEIYHFSIESQGFSIESRRHKIVDTVPYSPSGELREEKERKKGVLGGNKFSSPLAYPHFGLRSSAPPALGAYLLVCCCRVDSARGTIGLTFVSRLQFQGIRNLKNNRQSADHARRWFSSLGGGPRKGVLCCPLILPSRRLLSQP